MDVSIQMISNLELGKKAIRPENLVKVCSALDISADYILRGFEESVVAISLAEKVHRLPEKEQRIIELLVDSLLEKSL